MSARDYLRSDETRHERPVLWGFAVEVYRKGHRPRLHWRWGRITAILVGALILGYGAFTAALYYYVKERRQFEEVTIAQVITWPFNRAGFRQTMGEYFIERGKEELRFHNFSEGFYFLRAGVARSPENLEARLLLAELYEHGLRRHDLAIDILRHGLRYQKGDLEYLRTIIALMMRNELDYDIIALADDHLGPPPDDDPPGGDMDEEGSEQRRWQQTLAFAAAQAHFYRGNYDRAEDFLRAYGIAETPEGMHLLALLQWNRGRGSEAIALLESGLRRFHNHDRFLVQLSRFHRERGEADEARRYGVLRAINNPDNPLPRIDLLHSFHLMGDEQRKVAELESLLRNYSDHERVLHLIGNFAAEIGDEELALRVYSIAMENHFDVSNFLMLVLEAHVVARNYEAALAMAEEISTEQPYWLRNRMAVFNSLRAIAHFGVNRMDLGQLYLNELYATDHLRVDTLLAVSGRLRNIGFHDRAIDVLTNAHQRNPENQAALSALIEAMIDRDRPDDLPRLVAELLQMRRPAPSLLRKILHEMGRDRHFFDPAQRETLEALHAALGSAA